MLSVRRLTRAYGAHAVLRDLDLRISAGMRLGVIGPNGSGKTTLLRLLAGEDEPDAGAVGRAGQVQIGYARQDVTTVRGQGVLEAVIEGAADIVDAQRRLRLLEQQLSVTAAGPELDELLLRYGTLHDRFVNAAGYSLEAQARKVLAGLGFADAQMSADVATLSGGWMMRVVLARLLLTTPDVLLLDEPTNHLDLDSTEWLTEYLAGYDGAVVAVSHDRWFLDRVATHVLALDGRGGQALVRGNYSQYVAERETRLASQRATAAIQAREIAHTEAFVERFRAKASKARQVQSRIKALDRLERVEAPSELRSKLRLSLPNPPRSGRNVVRLDGAVKRFGRTDVFAGVNLVVERGAKIAVIGPNGAGKSTLLRLIAGLEAPTAGTVALGYNVTPAYFAQHQLDMLGPDRTVLAELDAALRDRTTNPRLILGAFGFPGDTVDKQVGQCSGGERARLALAKLVVGPANLLCLDEPTNHLDIDSRELLTAALNAYAGTVLLVTHDRALIRATAATICAVGDGDLTLHDGDLDSYLSAQRPAADRANVALPRDERKQRRQQAAADRARTSELRGQITDAERELEAAEQHLTDLQRSLADPVTYEDPERVRELSLAHAVASQRAAAAGDHWERLVADLDAAGDPAAQ